MIDDLVLDRYLTNILRLLYETTGNGLNFLSPPTLLSLPTRVSLHPTFELATALPCAGIME